MKHKGGMRKGQTRVVNDNEKLTEDTPLSVNEQRFITEYLKNRNIKEAYRNLGLAEGLSEWQIYNKANSILNRPNVKAEIYRIMDELHNQSIASGMEVMEYFTSVMRGELKDQLGLDAPLAERTKAAQELAKRTIDVENRRAGEPDQIVEIKLDWSRNK